MRTWSLESAFLKAYTTAAVAVQSVIDVAHTVEQLTRPVRRDVRDGDYEAVSPDGYYGYAEPDLDGAEQLADKEAEEEVWLGGDIDVPVIRTRPWGTGIEDVPGQSTLDDVVAQLCQLTYFVEDVRNIIQVSPAVSADARVSAAESGSTPPSPSVACTDPPPHRSDGLAPVVGGEGAAADSGHSPAPPAAARPPWSDLADALVEHRPSAKDDRPAVIAVICEVLAKHLFWVANANSIGSNAHCSCGARPHGSMAWREHVAPLIREALEPHRIYVKRGPMGEPVPVELRPDVIGIHAVVGCNHCDSDLWVVDFPNGQTKFICDDHGVVAHSKTSQ